MSPKEDDLYIMPVTNREYAAIVAGLRMLQDNMGLANLDILTNGHTLAPLTPEEIDRLIEKSHHQ